MQKVKIVWNDGIDSDMTYAESSDRVLQKFFTIDDWQFIKHIYQAVIDESDVQYKGKSIEFCGATVLLSCEEAVSELRSEEFFTLMAYLFDLMIVGANDDHHGIRYEPWWQTYTEVSYRLQHKAHLALV